MSFYLRRLSFSFFLLSPFLSIFPLAVYAESPPLQPVAETFLPKGTYPEDRFWKVAVVQWNPPGSAPLAPTADQLNLYMKNNRALMEKFIRQAAAAGAHYISLSEFATIGYPAIPNVPPEEDNYRNRADIAPYVETVPGPSTLYFGALAKELKVWIQFGMAEVDPETQKYYDDAVVVNDLGQFVAKYRKENLYEIETNFLTPGQQLATFQTPAGLFGLIVCSDIYDDSVLSRDKGQHVDVLSLSTSWAEQNTGMGYFQRAAQSVNSYVLAANQDYFPDSGVINPDGSTQSHIRQTLDSIAYGFLPLK